MTVINAGGGNVSSNAHYDLGTDAFGNMELGGNPTNIVPGTIPNHAGYNTGVGSGALQNITQGSFNTALGHLALANFTTANYGVEPQGGENTAVGEGCLNSLVDGYWNASVGRSALAASVHSVRNTAIGALALSSLNGDGATDTENTGVGFEVMNNATNGKYNTAIGALSMANGTPMTGDANTGVGHSSLNAITTGTNNTAVGKQALFAATTTGSLTAVGSEALRNCNATNNTALGFRAGLDTTQAAGVQAGTENTYVGFRSGPPAAVDPSQATALGSQAVAGSFATAIGYQTTVSGGGGAVALGYQAAASSTSALALGALASASGAGSVAIGRDHLGTAASATAQDQFVLGSANHAVQVPGTLAVTGSIGFFGHALSARPGAYTLNAGAVSRNLASGAALANVEQVLRQVITDLQGYGLLQ